MEMVGGKIAEVAITTAVQTLTNIITQQAGLLWGVSDKVVQLRDNLQWMQSFLKDADAEQEKNERFRNWVSQIREVACDAEDVIETYIAEAASQYSWNLPAKLILLHKVGKEIEKLQSRMQNISNQKEHFGISSIGREGREVMASSANERLRWWRQTSPSIEEDDLIDLVEDTKQLLTQLSSMEPRCRVVSIVGMGGLGKTTLAKKMYDHIGIKNQFDCKAFVYVSKEYSRRDTLQKIIVAVSPCNMDDLKKLEEEDLKLKLSELLKEKRYLVVLDDVWEKEVWTSLKAAFPSGKMGSKVMVTTRNREVALHADAMSKPLEPRFLTQDESLELFCKKAVPEMDRLPSDLENLGREMVAKCGGLPLAVVVLGGLLSSKTKTTGEWRRVLQSISSRLIGENHVSAILALSYNDLPLNLKFCFLHLGLFPEDYSIRRTKLIQLWVAEGFLPQQQGEEMAEDVAENCLSELTSRCMIQVETLTSLGRVKTIRMHDLLRDLSVSKGTEENFLKIYSGHEVESSSTLQSTKFRRIAIHARCNRYDFLKPFAPHLRCFHIPIVEEIEFQIDLICKNCKLLRVLDIVYQIPKVPRAIENLIQLRYLELDWWEDSNVPRSIGNLKNLRTLKLRSRLYSLPNVIWKLKNLRHLLLVREGRNFRMDTLSHLQSLKGIVAGSWIENGGLVSMTNLRRLSVYQVPRKGANLVISIIAERAFRYLESLSLSLDDNASFPTFTGLSHCESIHKLFLHGKIEKLPDSHEFPPNLVKLTLWCSEIGQDSIVKLERLPSLKVLHLDRGSYTDAKMVCSSEGFLQLQILHLEGLYDLEELIVEEGAMVKLKNLRIFPCPKLVKIPEGLRSLTTTTII